MKIIVIDSAGKGPYNQSFARYLPNFEIRGHSLVSGPEGAHGYQCAYYACLPCTLIHGKHELVLIRIFDADGNPIVGADQWMLDVLREECRPDENGKWPYINMSWGQDDGDNKLGELWGQKAWEDWAKDFVDVIGESVPFAASGNSDHNDLDNDISYPHRLLPFLTHIVGSHNRAGIPSEFSGDGAGVFLTMWGENVPLLDGDGFWARGSGTSFASPKACGLAAYLGLNSKEFREYVRGHATKPDKYSGYLPHVKWGWGSLEYRYQEIVSDCPDWQRPSRLRTSIMAVDEYRDWQCVKSNL